MKHHDREAPVPIILFLGLLWGTYLSLMLRKAVQDDVILTAVSFGAYLAIFLLALMKRIYRRSLFIHSAIFLVILLSGTGFVLAFVTATDGLEGVHYNSATATFRFLGEVFCLFQWFCVATSALIDWLTSSRKT